MVINSVMIFSNDITLDIVLALCLLSWFWGNIYGRTSELEKKARKRTIF